MFEWMFGNGWDSPGWTFPDSGEGTFKLCSATLGNGTVNGYQSHWYRAGNDCSDTEHFPITWTITFVSSVFNQYTRNGWNEYEGEFAADGDDTVFALVSYNTLNGNLAYGNLVDDVSVAAEDGDGGNLVTDGGFESPSLTKDGETGSANAPANAATGWRTTDPNRRIAIGHVSKDGQSDYLQMPVHVYVPDNSDGSNGNDQYAELNSNQASSLYQVVNTVPESKYDWGLYHRGRQGKDAMALVVGPKQNVAPMKTSATSGETKSVYSPVALFVRVDGTTTEVYANGGTQPIGNTGTANQYEIKMKRSDGITMEQKVKDADAADYTATTTAGVGDTVDFYVKLTIPAYKANAYASIVVNGTLTDLSIDPSSVKVHKDSANGDVIDGAVSYDAVTGKFTLAAGKVSAADTDMTVYLTYSATVAKGAATDTVHSATNSVTVTYNTETTATENGFTTASSSTTIYNYSLKVSKKSDSGKELAGAVFTFYSKQAAEGTDVIKFVKDGDADYYRPAQAVETAAVSELTAPFAIRGLDETTIYAKETTTPKGYTVPSGVFKATLVGAKESNNYTGLLDDTKSTIEAIAPADAGLVQSKTVNETKDWQYDVTIQNTRTSALPTTGSVGTVLFAVLGIALMAGAVWLYARSKRQSAK